MPEVTGNFRDITNGSLDSKEGVVVFTLNDTNLQVSGGGIRPDNSREAVPDASTGDFTINLAQTTNMVKDAWYDVSVEWLGEDEPLIGYLGIKIRVPSGGGQLDQLIDHSGQGGGPNRRIVWVGQSPPARPYPFMLWLKQEPGPNPDPFDERNTSDLYEWRP